MINNKATESWFDGVGYVVEHPDYFKQRLAIGEDAYTLLTIKNKLTDAWDVYGAATASASAAQSSIVASTFFAPSGFLSIIGIGAATTPLGWVVTASIVGGASYWGITKFISSNTKSRITVIPEFINTPLDILALGLFDLMAPLFLKIAVIDGKIDDSERELIGNYFTKKWGYNDHFVTKGLSFFESSIDEISIREAAKTFSSFAAENRDCNYNAMTEHIVELLSDVMQVDTQVNEMKEMAVEKVQDIFKENDPSRIKNRAKRARRWVTGVKNRAKNYITRKDVK